MVSSIYTTVVILAAELLKRSRQFVEDGVSPQLIIRAYRKASEEVGLLAVISWFLKVFLNSILRFQDNVVCKGTVPSGC